MMRFGLVCVFVFIFGANIYSQQIDGYCNFNQVTLTYKRENDTLKVSLINKSGNSIIIPIEYRHNNTAINNADNQKINHVYIGFCSLMRWDMVNYDECINVKRLSPEDRINIDIPIDNNNSNSFIFHLDFIRTNLESFPKCYKIKDYTATAELYEAGGIGS